MSDIIKYSKLENVENYPRDIKINFNEFSKVNIKVKEIYNCEITGNYSNDKGEFHGNIVLSYLSKFISKNTDFRYVDWKDSNLRNCQFYSNSLNNGAIINCHVANCFFEKCTYKNVSITGTIFFETDFSNCDFSNIIIENCYFYNCKFYDCITSNKIFEQCLFMGCEFNKTNIQLETIIENLGIEKNQLKKSKIRDKPSEENFNFLSLKDLMNLCDEKNKSLQNIFKFKVEYFLNPKIIIDGSALFDTIFNLNEWLPLCKAQSTFLNMFKLFHDFIIILFEHNKLPIFVIYKFKELTKWLSELPQIKNRFELYPTLIGYDIGLSRILSQINNVIGKYNADKKLVLLVNGPLYMDYYYDKFSKFIVGDYKILKIIKQNSPNLMEIVAISSVIIQIVALFITTRVKVELKDKKVKQKEKRNKRKKNIEGIDVSPYNISNVSVKNEDILKMYFAQSSFPQFEFSKISSQEFGKIRKIIISIYEQN